MVNMARLSGLQYAGTTLWQVISNCDTVARLSSHRNVVLQTPNDDILPDSMSEIIPHYDETCAIIIKELERHKIGEGDDSGYYTYDFGGKTVQQINATHWFVDPALSGCRTSMMEQHGVGSLKAVWIFAIM
jgi:hypothetical protein